MEDGVALGGGEVEALGDDAVLAATAGNLQGGAEILDGERADVLVLADVKPPTMVCDRSSVASAVTSWLLLPSKRETPAAVALLILTVVLLPLTLAYTTPILLRVLVVRS